METSDIKKYAAILLPYLLERKKGKPCSMSLKMSILCFILYKCKTGCQWRMLPMSEFSEEKTSWQNVYYHFRNWITDGVFSKAWTDLLKQNKSKLDMSIVNFDGSQTISKKGGEYVAYQNRKKAKTTNMLYMTDKQGVVISVSEPIAGNHNDLFNITTYFKQMINDLNAAEIATDGLFLNADAGFDGDDFREFLLIEGIIPIIPENPRNTKKNKELNTDYQHFDELCYQYRFSVERSFSWLDSLKNTLVRYDFLAKTWSTFVKISMLFILIRKFLLSFSLS